jgi:outer membrane protein assembly factor BamB
MIPYTMKNHALAALLMLGLLISSARAEDWPQWRGPHFNGSSEAKGLPEKLDSSTQAWVAQLPGEGSGTPIVCQGKIFLSCIDATSKKLLATCFSAKDGSLIWSKQVGVGFQQNPRNDTASPSAVTDGKTVWFYYGTGDLVAFDLDGNQKWARNIQKDYGNFNILWIYSSSPMFYQGKLYIQVLQRDVAPKGPASGPPADSYLLAMDANTGKDIWRHIRPNDAMGESKESYATPIPYENEGHTEILLVGGDCVSAHDPETGKELWRCGGWNPQKINHWRMVSSVVTADGLVFACPPKKGPIFAIKDGGAGDVTATHIAWKNPEITSDAAVPLVYKGNLYVLDGDKKVFYCVEPKTGKVLWSGPLGGHAVFRASPTGADNKIYCANETGDVLVLSPAEFKILSTANFGGLHNHASVAVTDGLVVVRAGEKLLAFK